MTSGHQEPVALLLFGPNCAGKSAVGEVLAGLLDRCAYIEVDRLRYMIAGGLVAWSGGDSPLEQPEEYERQCALGCRNAVALARGFGAAGFSSVIEGLGDECRPSTGWIEENFGALPVRSAVLICDLPVLESRWVERGGPTAKLPSPILKDLEWCRENASMFDAVVDTSWLKPERAARQLLQALAA